MCDLERLLGPVARALPTDLQASEVVLDRSVVPALPASVTTDRIVIRRGTHEYNGYWRADILHFFATPQTCRMLGVAILASLFAPPGSVTNVALTHDSTAIRTLRLRTPGDSPALTVAAQQYTYRPREAREHPWASGRLAPDDLPAAYLTDDDEIGGVTDADWQARDTVVGFGNMTGMSEMAQLLLDMGRPEATVREHHLEGEMGFRGVAPGSAEVSFCLPGSSVWDETLHLE